MTATLQVRAGGPGSMLTQPTTFVPPCTDYAERVRASFARQGAMRLLGASIVDVAPGHCALALVPRDEVSQQHGYVHAGVLAALVDTAGKPAH